MASQIEIAQRVVEAILSQKLAPGERLGEQDLADMDGDGLKDIVTGKRFWAHGPAGDVEQNDPAVLYWFRLVRSASGSVCHRLQRGQ